MEALWEESVRGTEWSELKLHRELANIDRLATKPRIPEDHLIFRIFRAFNDPRRQIRVVLLGQDPYPEMLNIAGEDEQQPMMVSRACGFSFSSPLGKLPLSLKRIFAEIISEYPQPMIEDKSRKRSTAATLRPVVVNDYSGDLSYLIVNGVFLLNTYLTIAYDGQRGNPLSHPSWIAFTTQVLNFIRRVCPKAVYLALGKKAADLLKASGINDAIECDHPANRFGSRNPFYGSGIFLKADALLEKRGIPKVSWIPMTEPIDTEYFYPGNTYLPQVRNFIEGPPPPPVDNPPVPADSDEDDVSDGEVLS